MKAITKVLVANRGEIAVRVIRAAADLGIDSVAVYTEPEVEQLPARLANEAFALTGSGPTAYLDIDQILQIAQRSGADAVHPGYGFLAENATFARAVIAAGLTWIGPPPEAIEILGDKVGAREVARRVGAPLAVGSDAPLPNAAAAVEFATRHGLPLVIKAVHGGGGHGMRVARTLDEVADQFQAATREAHAAFGRSECFVERYVDHPRHVETQCLADRLGEVVVVSTRDCTLQRRHQKLVEEAPAPFLSPAQSDTISAASKAILRAVGYCGAGTVEFLIGSDATISFLEVNTRLQVEHPVSEQVTGIDLVTEMFRLAAGEPLGYSDPTPRGHAIEFRINAEDAARGFQPDPGIITRWEPPGGAGVRLDEGYREMMAVSPEFDSLIAKLIITGADRDEALRRARRALAEFHVDGLATLVPFHRALLEESAFLAPDGVFEVDTDWVERDFLPGVPPRALAGPAAPERIAPTGGPSRERVVVEVAGRRVEVVVPPAVGPAPGRPVSAARRGAGSRRRAQHHGDDRDTSEVSGGAEITAIMPATLVAVHVAEGDMVERGAALMVLEAMKMEQPILAPVTGQVTEVRAQPGQRVVAGELLCRIVTPQDADDERNPSAAT